LAGSVSESKIKFPLYQEIRQSDYLKLKNLYGKSCCSVSAALVWWLCGPYIVCRAVRLGKKVTLREKEEREGGEERENLYTCNL
jgi:hypothetical protein